MLDRLLTASVLGVVAVHARPQGYHRKSSCKITPRDANVSFRHLRLSCAKGLDSFGPRSWQSFLPHRSSFRPPGDLTVHKRSEGHRPRFDNIAKTKTEGT